jgi:hypothetical protein
LHRNVVLAGQLSTFFPCISFSPFEVFHPSGIHLVALKRGLAHRLELCFTVAHHPGQTK